MVAIREDVYLAMVDNLHTMKDRIMATVPFEMTHEECLELTAAPDIIELLKTAATVADISNSEEWITLASPFKDGEHVCSIHLHMRTHGQKSPPLRPRHPRWHACYAGERVLEWMTQRYKVGEQFALAEFVLHNLRNICETGAQLRYIWPSVLLLCGHNSNQDMQVNERMKAWAERHAVFKSQRSMPALSKPLKLAIQETAGTITAASLLGSEPRQPHRTETQIMEAHGELGYFDWHGVILARQ